MLNTDVALQGQALDGHDVNIGITEDAPRGVLVIARIVKGLYRVVNIAAQHGNGIGKYALGRIDGNSGMLTHSAVGDATVTIGVGTTVVPLGNHQVLTHTQVLVEVVGRVHTTAQALVERAVHQTVLVDVAAREQVGTLLAAITDAGGDVVGPCVAVNGFLPVGVGSIDAIDR